MSNTTAVKCSFRRTKSGEWVVYGPAEHLNLCLGEYEVEVTKANGETKMVALDRVGKSFIVDGVAMAYGYVAQTERRSGSSRRFFAANGHGPQGYGATRGHRACVVCGGYDCDGC